MGTSKLGIGRESSDAGPSDNQTPLGDVAWTAINQFTRYRNQENDRLAKALGFRSIDDLQAALQKRLAQDPERV